MPTPPPHREHMSHRSALSDIERRLQDLDAGISAWRTGVAQTTSTWELAQLEQKMKHKLEGLRFENKQQQQQIDRQQELLDNCLEPDLPLSRQSSPLRRGLASTSRSETAAAASLQTRVGVLEGRLAEVEAKLPGPQKKSLHFLRAMEAELKRELRELDEVGGMARDLLRERVARGGGRAPEGEGDERAAERIERAAERVERAAARVERASASETPR